MADKTKEEDGFWSGLYRKVKNKVIEEIKQFREMGGVEHTGEYVAENFVSFEKGIAETLGLDNAVEGCEMLRPLVVKAGKYVDSKVAEEVQQFNDMGGAEHAGEYVAQNFTSAIKYTVEAFGLDGQPIEDSRAQFVKYGKIVDREIQDIREELRTQQGELLSSPKARSQDMRLQKKIETRPQTEEGGTLEQLHKIVEKTAEDIVKDTPLEFILKDRTRDTH